jgi:hypothetical protein
MRDGVEMRKPRRKFRMRRRRQCGGIAMVRPLPSALSEGEKCILLEYFSD